jgi:hypothetical protein
MPRRPGFESRPPERDQNKRAPAQTLKRKFESVPETVPELDPIPVTRDPTRTKSQKENGPEIIDFRPVL